MLKDHAFTDTATRDGYSTADERQYLDGLGTYRRERQYLDALGTYGVPPARLRTRPGWLRAYIDAAALRKEWGSIDREEVLDYARGLLEKRLRRLGAPIQEGR